MDLDDIVFENRNKDYGAYPIRKGYKKRFWFSMLLSIIVIVVVFMIFDNSFKEFLPPPPKPLRTIDVKITEYKIPKPIQPNEPKKLSDKKLKEELRAKTEKASSNPLISNNTIFKNGDLFINPNTPENVGSIDVAGPDIDVKAVLKVDTSKSIEKKTLPIDDMIKSYASTKVQDLPHYVGGDSAWYQYLRHNININQVLRNGAMPSVYTAIVAFIVHSDSTISDFKIVKDPGFGMGMEALKVVQKSGKWVPGKKNNKPIKFAQLQTIVFKINNN